MPTFTDTEVAVREPIATQIPQTNAVRIDIVLEAGRKRAFVAPDGLPLIKAAQQAAWYCTDRDTNVVVRFERESPFGMKEFPVPRDGTAVPSGAVKGAAAVCSECPAKPLPHREGHFKYSVVEVKTNAILADPEIIIRN